MSDYLYMVTVTLPDDEPSLPEDEIEEAIPMGLRNRFGRVVENVSVEYQGESS